MRHSDWRDEMMAVRPRLRRYAVKILSGDEEGAEDVLSEAFLRCLKSGYDAGRGATVFTWAANAVYCAAMDHIRREGPNARRKKRRGQLVPLDELYGTDFEISGYDLEADFDAREDAQFGYRVVMELSEETRNILQLKVDGLTFEKIGALFGKKSGWARTKYLRALEEAAKAASRLRAA